VCTLSWPSKLRLWLLRIRGFKKRCFLQWLREKDRYINPIGRLSSSYLSKQRCEHATNQLQTVMYTECRRSLYLQDGAKFRTHSKLKLIWKSFLPYDVAFNLNTFHVCPYKYLHKHIHKNSFTLSTQNGRLPRWYNFAANMSWLLHHVYLRNRRQGEVTKITPQMLKKYVP
jgi:hypothetical protein